MKKLPVILIGLFMFVACSEDAVQNAESQKGNPELGNTVKTIDSAIPYESPYDNSATCCSAVNMNFINNTDLNLEFEPYGGLARFDGAYDSYHFGWGIPLNATNYPNLISNETDEYFKLVRCKPVQIGAFSSFNQLTGQFPVPNLFSIASPTTSAEIGLLYEFGKFYALNAKITDPNNGNAIVQNNAFLRFPFLPPGYLSPNQLSGNWIQMPSNSIQTTDLWYHNQTLEICVGSDPGAYPGGGDGINNKPSELLFNYNGKPYILKLYTTSSDVVVLLDYN